MGAYGPGDAPLRNPITGIVGCCARAASGQAAAAPTSVARNFRRPMVTVIRPSRARCVKETIPRHERAVPNSAAPGAVKPGMDDEPVVPRPCSRRQDNRKWELRARPGLRDGWHRIRISGITEHPLEDALLWLDVGGPDHLGPFLSFVDDELSEFSRHHRHRHAAEVGKARLDLGIGKDRIDFLVKLLDDLDGGALRRA